VKKKKLVRKRKPRRGHKSWGRALHERNKKAKIRHRAGKGETNLLSGKSARGGQSKSPEAKKDNALLRQEEEKSIDGEAMEAKRQEKTRDLERDKVKRHFRDERTKADDTVKETGVRPE